MTVLNRQLCTYILNSVNIYSKSVIYFLFLLIYIYWPSTIPQGHLNKNEIPENISGIPFRTVKNKPLQTHLVLLECATC